VYIGAFASDDRLVNFMQNGDFKLTGYDLSTHFDDDMVTLKKHDPEEIISLIYLEGETGRHYLKRFTLEEDIPIGKRISMIGEHPQSSLIKLIFDELPVVRLSFYPTEKGKQPEEETIEVASFIAVKSFKAKGKRLSTFEITEISVLEPLIIPVEDADIVEETGTDKEDEDSTVNQEEIDVNVSVDQVKPAAKPEGPLQMELDF
jgi:topoisomerase-4 subunit A